MNGSRANKAAAAGAAPPQAGTIPQLTALRFFAAFVVLLSHLDFLESNASPVVGATYTLFLHQGFCGVSFFYVLSGFIISHAYRDRLATGRIGAGTYLYHRLTRIMPLHWLTALLFAGWLTIAEADPPRLTTLLLNLGLLHAWFPAMTIHYSLNGPSWSLSDELFFYIAFIPLVRVPIRGLCWIAALGGAAIAGLALISALTVEGYSNIAEWFFYVSPATRLLEFVTGMILYHAWRSGQGRRFSTTRVEAVLILAVPAAMVGFAVFEVPMPFRYQLAWLPLMAALVLVFAHGRGGVTRLLRTRLLVLLGEASFALYHTHRPIVTLAHQLVGDPARGWRDVALALLLVPLCAAVSIFVFLNFERPVLRWSRGGRRTRRMDAPAM
jgi:peptidoglycan/LPS O-acetylase OafA/YrhL